MKEVEEVTEVKEVEEVCAAVRQASGYKTSNRYLGIGKLGSLFCRIS